MGIGEVPIQLPNDNTITLHQLRHVPALKRSLVSIGMVAEDGCRMTLNESTWMISRGNLQIGSGHKYNNLYPLMAINPEGAVNVAKKTNLNLWQGRLSHTKTPSKDKLLRALLIQEIDLKSTFSPLRDGTKPPRTNPFRHMRSNARKIC